MIVRFDAARSLGAVPGSCRRCTPSTALADPAHAATRATAATRPTAATRTGTTAEAAA